MGLNAEISVVGGACSVGLKRSRVCPVNVSRLEVTTHCSRSGEKRGSERNILFLVITCVEGERGGRIISAFVGFRRAAGS